MRRNLRVIKIMMILGSSIYMGCNGADEKAVVAAPTESRDTVAAFVLQDTAVAKTIELPAELLPYEKAELFARVEGYVREMKVDLGDRVRRGQTLAIIEAPELNTKYAEFQASLQAAKAKFNSSADIYQRMQKASMANTPGIVAPVDLERSRNQYLADSASYEASRQLARSYQQVAGYLVLQAPFDGVVTARHVDRGALVGRDQPLLSLQHNSKLRLRLAVPEIYVASAAVDDLAAFRVDAFPEKIFKARLSRKSESIDESTRTELWEYEFDNSQRALKAGAFAYVKLKLARTANSFVVQPSAIATNQERKFVIRIKNGEVEWVDVRQGMSTDKGVEIFGDIRNGDSLLVRANDEIKPGYKAVWRVVL